MFDKGPAPPTVDRYDKQYQIPRRTGIQARLPSVSVARFLYMSDLFKVL